MKRRLMICVLFFYLVTGSAFLYAEEPADEQGQGQVRSSRQSVHALGYGGILTLGYQMLVTEEIGLNIEVASIALLHEDLRDGFAFPVYVTYYPIGSEHRLFMDLGFNFITKGKSNPNFDFNDGMNIVALFGAGYVYHPNNGGLFIKAGWGGFIYNPARSDALLAYGTMWSVGLGYAF